MFKTQFVKKSKLNYPDSILSISDKIVNYSNSIEDFQINEVSGLNFIRK